MSSPFTVLGALEQEMAMMIMLRSLPLMMTMLLMRRIARFCEPLRGLPQYEEKLFHVSLKHLWHWEFREDYTLPDITAGAMKPKSLLIGLTLIIRISWFPVVASLYLRICYTFLCLFLPILPPS